MPITKLSVAPYSILLAAATLLACDARGFGDAEDDPGDTDGDTESDNDDDADDGNDDGDSQEDCRESEVSGDQPDGAQCSQDDQCESSVCSVQTALEPQTDTTCEPAPPGCNTRVLGTVREIGSWLPLAGVDVSVLAAAVAANGPASAPQLLASVSDSNGRFDVVSEVALNAPYAVVGLAAATDYQTTLTGLDTRGSSGYPAVLNRRDWWLLPASEVETWNQALAADAETELHVPIENSRVVVGIVRTAENPSSPIGGATATPIIAQESNAIILYLDEDRLGFNRDFTASHGTVLILAPGIGETFVVSAPERMPRDARVSGFPDVVYISDISLEPL